MYVRSRNRCFGGRDNDLIQTADDVTRGIQISDGGFLMSIDE
jgi:hypothetical protein